MGINRDFAFPTQKSNPNTKLETQVSFQILIIFKLLILLNNFILSHFRPLQ